VPPLGAAVAVAATSGGVDLCLPEPCVDCYLLPWEEMGFVVVVVVVVAAAAVLAVVVIP